MAVLLKKRQHVPEVKSIHSLAWIKMFNGAATAAITTILALYINSFVNSTSATGFISGFLSLVSFISFFLFVPLIQRSNKGRLYISALAITIISYVLFALIKSLTLFIIIAALMTIIQTIRVTTMGIMVKDKSKKSHLTKNEGLLFTFINIGFVVGPLIAGYLAANYGIRSVFYAGALLSFISLMIFKIKKVEDDTVTKKATHDTLKNFKAFFHDKKRITAYILGGGSQFWWILIYLFMPLFIVEQGYSEGILGYFFFAIALPLILTEYYFANLARKIGFKKVFMLGFLIPTAAALTVFFLTNTLAIIGVLIVASFGLAMLEPTTEAYFLSMVGRSQAQKFFGPYNTTFTLNQFIAKIVPSLLLLILPFKFIFLAFACFMFIFFLVARKA